MQFRRLYPRILAQRKIERIKKGYHAALVLDLCFAVLAFVVIETLHTQISSLFLGKDGTALAYQVSGDYMRWLGYFFHLHGHQDGTMRSSRTRNHAAVSYCKYGKPCDPLVCCFDLCTAFLALLLFGLQSRQVGLQTSLFPMRRSEDHRFCCSWFIAVSACNKKMR